MRFARSIRLLSERADLPVSHVQSTKDDAGQDAVQVEWRLDGRHVQVLVSCRVVKIVCFQCGLPPCWVDARRNFIEQLRRALAWLMGEEPMPF
jgi:hypothetical protein